MSESERLASMSSNVLLLTKLENQGIISDRTTFDLSEQLRDCLLSLQSQWEEKDLSLNLGLASNVLFRTGSLSSYFDESALQRHKNFFPSGREHRFISGILSESRGGEPTTVFGMDSEARFIFRKFYQGDRPISRPATAGLSIVSRIVEIVRKADNH